MAQMSMNKVIHGAIRRDLDRFVGARSPPSSAGDTARAQQLGRAWDNFDLQLTDHHEGEHEIAWPALESVGVTRETIAQMDAEHETMAAALAEARTAMRLPASTAGQGEAEAALPALMHLRDVTVDAPRPRGARDRAGLPRERRGPRDEGDGQEVLHARARPRAGVFFAWVLDGATARAEAGAHEQRARTGAEDPHHASSAAATARTSLRSGAADTLGIRWAAVFD